MGTRHLIAVHLDGKYPVAQYGQWDGYPSGQGLVVLGFLRTMIREQFVAGLQKAFEPTEEQIKQWWLDVGHDIEKSDGYVSCDIADKFGLLHPSLSRDTGAKVLPLIQNALDPVPVRKALDFAGDSLFCEWAYVIDLDKNTLEVYEGFNKTPVPAGERFADLPTEGEYYPVKTYALDELPNDEDFVNELEKEEENA